MTSPPSPSEPHSSAFERLHRDVQEWVYRRGWSDLRDIQEEAIRGILQSDRDIIIASATASGKTEAAFLPLCSQLREDCGGGVHVLCVSPLKALINDQFERLDDLCESLEIPVLKRHGDVGNAQRKKLLENPSGILLITPESLEALFIRHGPHLAAMFRPLRAMVVDELHAFLGNERGQQLRSLLQRMEHLLGRHVRRIGLSATLGDLSVAARQLRPNGADQVQVITSTASGQGIKLLIKGFITDVPQVKPVEDAKEEEAVEDLTSSSIVSYLFTNLRGTANLVFANRKSEVEMLADQLSRRCERERVPNEFLPHHGSLSKSIREEVEDQLKERERPLTVICTSTLEMGLDVGSVKSVAQVGPPPSVASLRQRLGRSGRRGEAAILRIIIDEHRLEPDAHPADQIRPALVQAVAMCELLLDRWVEPPDDADLHYSTLIQQVLSVIAQFGGARADRLFTHLCASTAFGHVTQQALVSLLKELGRQELIEQGEQGVLHLAPKGERLVNHYSFYTAFATYEEFRVVNGGRTLGSLPVNFALAVDSFLIFAGKRWRVTSVDPDDRVIEVVRAKGGIPPAFLGGGVQIHDRVRQKMREVLNAEAMPVYLDKTGQNILISAREAFRRFALDRTDLVECGRDLVWLPWRGDKILGTLMLLLKAGGHEVTKDGVGLTIGRCDGGTFLERCRTILSAPRPQPGELAAQAANIKEQKHDDFLPIELFRAGYAARSLDIPNAWETLGGIR